MATWFRPVLTPDEQVRVLAGRDHPDPAVRRKRLVLWAVHLGHTRAEAARIAHVGTATATRYVLAFRDGQIDGLIRCDRHVPVGELAAHADAVRTSLAERPVRTAAEAAGRIEDVTGLRRGLTQTRTFLASLGFRWQSIRAVPVPPKSPCPNTSRPSGPSAKTDSGRPSTPPRPATATPSSPTPPTSSTAPT